jgi:hypothetical protein
MNGEISVVLFYGIVFPSLLQKPFCLYFDFKGIGSIRTLLPAKLQLMRFCTNCCDVTVGEAYGWNGEDELFVLKMTLMLS